jgi:hypothetical protein
LLAAALGAPACSSSKTDAPADGQPSRNHPAATPPPDDSGKPKWNADCDPLVPYHCGFPFPSNTQLKDDPTSPTKKRVNFAAGVLPLHSKKATDPTAWSYADGFSPGMNLTTVLPYATSTGLADENHLADSITTSSPTIILDTSTGQLVPHIAELDVQGAKKQDELGFWNTAFMLRPVVRLKDSTRYIVAIRHVVDDKGTQLDPSPEFKNLREGTPSSEKSIEARRDLYKDIFAKLEAAGIKTADLQLAWDFSTASKENNTQDMIAYRDAAIVAFKADEPTIYTIDKVTDDPNTHIKRRIEGTVTVPCFLDNCALGTPNHPVLPHINRGTDGKPKQNGTYALHFQVQIPQSLVKAGAAPGPVLGQGHGLLGDKEEGQNGYFAADADLYGMVTVVTDLQGMASEDHDAAYGDAVTETLTGDIGTWKSMVDRQHMGLVNELLVMKMMKGAFSKDAKVTELTADKHSPIDTTTSYYRGDSQGGIFGTTYMSISTDVTRGILGEPGGSYSMILYRSEDFGPFFFLLGLQYADSLDVNVALGLVQMLWDRTEPDGYMPYISENMLPGTPKHNVLLNCAIGDHQVSTLGAHVIARAIGAKNLKPTNREIFQIPSADGPFTGNGITEVNFNLPPVPLGNEPMTAGEDPHDKVRQMMPIMLEEQEFLKNGNVKNFCGGACTGT